MVFHNGGGYDFHFLLRYIATARARQKAASPRGPWPRLRQRPRPRPRPRQSPSPAGAPCRPRSSRRLQPPLPPSLQVGREVHADELGPAEVHGQHERLPHEPGQHDRRPQGLHAQAAAGALPADGLASPRAAAAHADRLSAPKTASQTAADALQPGAGVGLHPAQAAHALRALLRRRGVGDARGVGANLMGWETFREFHDCYLHTNVLALADVMESYRDSFRAQSALDPIHYVTLPGAA